MATQSQAQQIKYSDFIPRDSLVHCPICQERFSMRELDQHLDDAHSSSQAEDTNAVLSWIKKAHNKITKEINIKSSSDALQKSFSNIPQQIASSVQNLQDANINVNLAAVTNGVSNSSGYFSTENKESQDLVTKDHWQREKGDGKDVCGQAGCGKTLGRLGVGKVHCRKCGRLFCDNHVQHQMRLSPTATHDPVGGYWCRVCEHCFVTREGYGDVDGVTKNHTADFMQLRKKAMEKVHLMENRLEKRMEKLAKIYATQDRPRRSSSTSILRNTSSLPPFADKFREQEKSVVKWEDDTAVLRCPFCAEEFNRVTLRKHHCRLCGRVVCAKQSCSSLVPLFLNMSVELYDQEPIGETRACWDCRNSVFRRKEHAEVMARPPQDVKLYMQLMELRMSIDAALPEFQDMMMVLEAKTEDTLHTHPNHKVAARKRKELLDQFAQFDAISKKIVAIPTKRADHIRLHQAIHTSAIQYLQTYMLPLQMLPKILKPSSSTKSSNGVEPISQIDIPEVNPAIQEQKAVLQEQYDLVEGFLKDAQKRRKLEDVKSLKANLDALEEEIARLGTEV